MQTSAMVKAPIDAMQFASSNLRSGLYDYGTQDLYIRFQGEPIDRIYIYQFVPSEVWEALKAADSHGSYHYQHIRMAYAYEEISRTDWPQQGRSAPETTFLTA